MPELPMPYGGDSSTNGKCAAGPRSPGAVAALSSGQIDDGPQARSRYGHVPSSCGPALHTSNARFYGGTQIGDLGPGGSSPGPPIAFLPGAARLARLVSQLGRRAAVLPSESGDADSVARAGYL
jgi:hypothetical protein